MRISYVYTRTLAIVTRKKKKMPHLGPKDLPALGARRICDAELAFPETCVIVSVNTYSRSSMRITQQDIARIANVSQATVSRVLSGDSRVEQDIRDRVLRTMQENNYQPDVRARSLRKKRAGLVGLVVKRPVGGLGDDPFFANLISHILDFLGGRPYHLCLEMVATQSSQEAVYDEMLRTRRVDGLILVEPEARDERIHRLQQDNFPFVLIGNPINDEGGICSVDNDNLFAGEMATLHLLNAGYRRVGMLAGPHGIAFSEDRIIGYQRAIRQRQDAELIWHSDFGFVSAREAAFEALLGADRPDALVVLDDFMAMGVVVAARSLGLRIPEDLGIASFNDSSVCDLVEGGLSSVSLNIPQIVRSACGRLLKIIEGKEVHGPRRMIVPCELRVRGSSMGPAADKARPSAGGVR
jgi:DNA-binding LacI/PurR family transcriptional regulator